MEIKSFTYKGIKLQHVDFDAETNLEELPVHLFDLLTDVELEEDESRKNLLAMSFTRKLAKTYLEAAEYTKWGKLTVAEYSEAIELATGGETLPKD